jgi:hypothetical protein
LGKFINQNKYPLVILLFIFVYYNFRIINNFGIYNDDWLFYGKDGQNFKDWAVRVWVGEGLEPTILRYLKSPKSYTKCASCNFQTEKLTSSNVIREATYNYSGEELLRYSCLHCGNTSEKIRTIPKKVRSSSGGSGGGRSGGGSWGGGRSSGGGAGGSW